MELTNRNLSDEITCIKGGKNMYKLNYKLDDNDYITFNKYHFETSSTGKKALFMFRLIIPFICLMFLIIFFVAESDSSLIITEAIFMAVLSILWVIFAKKMYLISFKRFINKLRKQGKLPYSCEGTLIFDEEFINDVNPITETKTRYSNIEKLGITETAIYIYFSAVQAYIVPKTCFGSEKEKQDFLNFITSRVNTK